MISYNKLQHACLDVICVLKQNLRKSTTISVIRWQGNTIATENCRYRNVADIDMRNVNEHRCNS